MTTASHSASGTGFRDDVQRLSNAAGVAKEDMKRDLSEVASAGKSAARSGLAELKDASSHLVHDAKAKADEATQCTRDYIARNPLTAVGIAAGVGLLLGIVLSHRPRI